MSRDTANKELFIPADLRPEARPFLQTSAPLDPDASHAEIERQARQVLAEWKRAGLLEAGSRSLTNPWPCIFERSSDVVWTAFEDECVLLHLGATACYSLNSAAAEFWKLCDGHKRAEQVLAEVCNVFDAPEGVVREDLRALLAQFLQEGLVVERTN